MINRNRALAYAGILTLAVGAVAGLLAQMVVPLDYADSTVEARIANSLLKAVGLAVAVLYVAIPLGIAAARAREGRRWWRQGGLAVLAVFGPPAVIVGSFMVVDTGILPDWDNLILLVVAPTIIVCATAVIAAGTLGYISDSENRMQGAWSVGLNLVVVIVFVAGVVGVQFVAGGFASTHTETYGGFGGPNALFTAEERPVAGDRVIVAFTHDGGDPMLAEHLEVRGEGFADVEDVDQTSPGAWQGEVSGELPRRGGAAVVFGDTVTIGATQDCEIRLVYDDGESRTTAVHSCGEHDG